MGEWLPMQTDLHQHQATLSIADATGLDPDAVVGKLLRVWGWARERTITGHLSGGVLTMIDRVAGVAGFGAAMSRAVSDDGTPWVVAGEGKLTFPKWDKWLSNGAKARALDADRKRRTRAKDAGQGSDTTRTEVGRAAGQLRTPSYCDVGIPSLSVSSSSDSESTARKVEARIASETPPTSNPLYDTAEGLLAGLFGREGGLPSNDARHLGAFVGWVESQPAPTIHGAVVAPDVLALKCVEAAVQDRIDGTVKGACSWCRTVFDRAARQGCWPHESPERKSKFTTVKPKRDYERLAKEGTSGHG